MHEPTPGEAQSTRQALQLEAVSSALGLFFQLLSELRPDSLDLLQSARAASPCCVRGFLSMELEIVVKQSEDSLVEGIWLGLGLSAQALWKMGAKALLSVLFNGLLSAAVTALEAMNYAEPEASQVKDGCLLLWLLPCMFSASSDDVPHISISFSV